MPAAVATTSLHKSYGDVEALRGVDLHVAVVFVPLSAWRYRQVDAR